MKEESNCFGLIIWIRAARGYTHLLRALSGLRDGEEGEMRKKCGDKKAGFKEIFTSICPSSNQDQHKHKYHLCISTTVYMPISV